MIKLICFDFDDTLTSSNSWYRLNTALGISDEEDSEMYLAFRRGELIYTDWLAKIQSLYRERKLATKERMTDVLVNFDLRPGVMELMKELKSRGYLIAIISGGFDITIEQAANLLEIKYYRAGSKINFDSDNNFLSLASSSNEGEAKVDHLKEICAELNIKTSECACVGDGANDIEIFKETGYGICFKDASTEVLKSAKTTINDLSDLLKIFL